MKRMLFRLLLLLLLVSGVSACQEGGAEPQPEFFVKATKDGKSWLVPGSAAYDPQQGGFYVFGSERVPLPTQSFLRLGFRLPPNKPLTAVIKAPATVPSIPAIWHQRSGEDLLTTTNSYTQAAVPTPQLSISRLDTGQRIVEGTFEANLLRDARWSAPGETIRLTKGSFRLRYTQIL